MRRIEPQPDRSREIRSSNPPSHEWRLAGGLAGGGLVYEHRDGARAYLHMDQGDVTLAGWDPAGETALPDREALETIAARDLRALQASERAEDQALLIVSGVSLYSVVRNHGGRKRRWTDNELGTFASEFVERGASWSSEHERWAQERWNLGQRRALEIMRKAEAAGVVAVTKRGGSRSPNVYWLTGRSPDARPPQVRADWHRAQWIGLNRKRRELEANWQAVRAGT